VERWYDYDCYWVCRSACVETYIGARSKEHARHRFFVILQRDMRLTPPELLSKGTLSITRVYKGSKSWSEYQNRRQQREADWREMGETACASV
jgi:hypothetical protein